MKSRTSSEETVPGWWVKLISALIEQAPRPGEIDQTTAMGWNKNQKALKEVLAQALVSSKNQQNGISSISYRVMMACTMTLSEMIKLCNCNYNDPDINDKNFQIQSTGNQVVEMVLVTVKAVLAWLVARGEVGRKQSWVTNMQIIAFMSSHGLFEALIEHLLFFGIANPDVQQESPIVALGSVWIFDDGDRSYPYLGSDGSKRKLDLSWLDDDNPWLGHCRFLAVRK